MTGSDPPAATHQAEHEQYDRNHEQYVDEVPERVAADQSEQPQHQQNHRNRKKHQFPPAGPFSTSRAVMAAISVAAWSTVRSLTAKSVSPTTCSRRIAG